MRHAHLKTIVSMLLLLALITSCSPSKVDSSSAGTAVTTGGAVGVVQPISLQITATPSSLVTGGTSQVIVHAVDATGSVVPEVQETLVPSKFK